ncbi:MAG: rod shape-determining protein MreD [Rhodobacteraceae bacterium]|nr:rod shape-determining protein MreD [Paracoccaceae bacterium]
MAGNAVLAGLWLGRLAYFGCAAAILFFALAPLGFVPKFTPQPDLLLCLTFTFVLRRPEFAPVWLVAAVFLLADILLLGPPGLWTAIVVLLTEFTRTQEYRFREQPFLFEWAFVAGAMFLALLANRLLLVVALVPLSSFGAVTLHYLVSVLAYPLVVLFCYFFLRIRKISPDEAIRYGHRL